MVLLVYMPAGIFFQLGQLVFTQIIAIFGIFFLFGFILSMLQRATHRQYVQTLGWRGILWTAWIGTPIHELGHVVFAKIFRHRVHRISLFAPNAATGNLGSVDHSFNPKSLYQRIGNFFVGAAPLIFGAVFLTLLLRTLVPNEKAIFQPLAGAGADIGSITIAAQETLARLFAPENLGAWNFWLFLYISFCIASHMAPSRRDLRGMWRGFFWIIILLFIANSVALLLGKDITAHIMRLHQYLGIVVAMFLYATILSLLHLVAATILLFPFRKY